MQAELSMLKDFQNNLSNRLLTEGHKELSILHQTNNILSSIEDSYDERWDVYVDQTDLCIELITEESDELIEIIEKERDPKPEKILKEVCDLLYVTLGFAARYVEFDKLPEAFKRVHENNMLKITKGTFNDSGKLVKPEDHPQVDLSDLVKGD